MRRKRAGIGQSGREGVPRLKIISSAAQSRSKPNTSSPSLG
jgi:hypothetical protein